MKDLHNFTEQLFTQLSEELSVYADLGTLPVRKLTGAIASIQDAVAGLKKFSSENGFKDQDEEIHFFKHEKPRFTAEHFYAMEIFTIETARPLNDAELLKVFYQQELKYIRRFLEANKFLYAYYQFDMKELDQLLFVRGAKPADIPVPDVIGLDPAFATCCDNLWGRFMALERLQAWLEEEIDGLNGGGGTGGPPDDGKGPVLKWTGETINLVEIAYGIWLTGQVNHGNASISEIVLWLEKHFAVRVGKAHRRWQNISGRKRLSYTRYLDECKAAIEKRVEDEFGR
jgi:hypothetical protein